MAMVKCPECGHDISSDAQACPRCGKPLAGVAIIAATATTNVQRNGVALVLLLALLAVFFGNFRIVSGAPNIIVERSTFGFDEPFASVADCTTSSWIVASAQHGKLCADLQAAGILESNDARTARVEAEMRKKMEEIQAQVRRSLRQ